MDVFPNICVALKCPNSSGTVATLTDLVSLTVYEIPIVSKIRKVLGA